MQRITKTHWRQLGGLANPSLARIQIGKGKWGYYLIAK